MLHSIINRFQNYFFLCVNNLWLYKMTVLESKKNNNVVLNFVTCYIKKKLNFNVCIIIEIVTTDSPINSFTLFYNLLYF